MRVWMYHPDNARDGQIFETDDQSIETLEAMGWVDDPAKFGYSPTGQASQQHLEQTKAQHQRVMAGLESAPASGAELITQNTRLEQELADMRKQLNIREQELDGMRTKLSAAEERALAAEKAQDEISDALKGGRDAGKDSRAAHEAAAKQDEKPAAKTPAKKAPAKRKRAARTSNTPEA